MMEFNLVVRIDTQDAQLAYNELRQALNYTGLDITISNEWQLNNRPLAEAQAEAVAARWLASHDPLTVDRRIKQKGKWQDEYRRFMAVVDSLPTYEELKQAEREARK